MAGRPIMENACKWKSLDSFNEMQSIFYKLIFLDLNMHGDINPKNCRIVAVACQHLVQGARNSEKIIKGSHKNVIKFMQ